MSDSVHSNNVFIYLRYLLFHFSLCTTVQIVDLICCFHQTLTGKEIRVTEMTLKACRIVMRRNANHVTVVEVDNDQCYNAIS